MSRDALTRMDVDTNWAYHRKVRRLQQQHPEHWPAYWAAYMALLGEAWRSSDPGLTLLDAWVPAMPCSPEEALAALVAAKILTDEGCIPADSWQEWFGPTQARIDAARYAANKRHHGDKETAPAMPSHSGGNANSQPVYPASHPARPRPRAREGALRPDGGPEHVAKSLAEMGFTWPQEADRGH